MSKQLFGTDGIRGVAGEYPLDPRTVYVVGLALAQLIREPGGASAAGRPQILIGMDTRESSVSLARNLAAGLDAGGVGVRSAGVIPTAAVAYLTVTDRFASGVMISASHNSFEDNGIKVFGADGFKLSDDRETRLEEMIFEHLDKGVDPSGSDLITDPEPANQYLNHLLRASGDPQGLASQKVIVDCANGAASFLAPRLFKVLGIAATIIHCQPNGRNINQECGSLYLDALQKKVVAEGADWGVAFDGDADRALFVAHDGAIIDGDSILLVAAEYMAANHRLTSNLVVTTIMANMGLEKALEKIGLRMVRTAVGDKYVLEEMVRSGAVLGGEQSGHIIFREYATTGDGLLTACMLLRIMADAHKPLSALRNGLAVFPQKLQNIRVKRKIPISELPALQEAVARAEKDLAGRGRVVVRYSGTEPLVRIMVEAEDMPLVDEHVRRLVEVFQAQLGA